MAEAKNKAKGGGSMRRRSSSSRSRVTAQRITDPRSRVLAAFPWAATLSPDDQLRFAEELAGHPRDLPNSGLEALILGWKSRALEERSRHAA
jgi:hypothetical protein